uniref:Uncharacterized protein n=1 Tax=Rhizophora mucronata TaxID=61149 RepID=A0A2P2J7W5_RHIMU
MFLQFISPKPTQVPQEELQCGISTNKSWA